MNPHRLRLALAALAIALLAGAAGYGVAHLGAPAPPAAPPATRKVLYWYDPMAPEQHFDHPGLSPMGMQMTPRYAAASAAQAPGVRVSAAAEQMLGMRLATVERGEIGADVAVVGSLDFDQRAVAIVQARQAGFVERTYERAPADLVRAGAPLADLLVPAWGGAQQEFLAVLRTGDRRLIAAARQRLELLGMPAALISRLARTGAARPVVAIAAPIGGMLQSLDVRQGMSVAQGQTLARINGLASVWLEAAVPQAQAGLVGVGEPAAVDLTAFPGRTFQGRVTALLPAAQASSRTVTVRVELPNPGGVLRPGMFATAHLAGKPEPALLVPSEAVIETGSKSLVMLAEGGGRYRPVEVEVGRQSGDETQILAGLAAGQQVVASGEFLIDSEASLAGVAARPLRASPAP
ncbi:MAG TPA: efflux RND transporter periplasmic adaptor subunit [Caulobacteraceae bacterium]|nr:efflux RND transporter periplasmic adaptor subunit [Caulobacteraceae bacterium]